VLGPRHVYVFSPCAPSFPFSLVQIYDEPFPKTLLIKTVITCTTNTTFISHNLPFQHVTSLSKYLHPQWPLPTIPIHLPTSDVCMKHNDTLDICYCIPLLYSNTPCETNACHSHDTLHFPFYYPNKYCIPNHHPSKQESRSAPAPATTFSNPTTSNHYLNNVFTNIYNYVYIHLDMGLAHNASELQVFYI
jgi:hypothetical protein